VQAQQEVAAQVTAVRALLAAAACACALAILPGAALAHDATPSQASPAVAVQAAVEDLQADADNVADRPEVGGLTAKRRSHKPRRTNRRLRVRHGHGSVSRRASAVLWAGTAHQLKDKSKRHRAKRALMRRLMAVRGGLQA
jgi:hypothetical protein